MPPLFTSKEPAYSGLPIGIITFVLSAFIAIDIDWRTRFYSAFNGDVPAITQCLLNTIRLGSISKSSYLIKLGIKESEYEYQHGKRLYRTFFDPEFLSSQKGFGILLLWFTLLEKHSKSSDYPYFGFVKLDKVSILSSDPVILCNLSARDEKVFWKRNAHFNSLSEQEREAYLLLCIGLDGCLGNWMEKADYLDGSYNSVSFESSEITKKIVDFILSGCKDLLPL